MEKDGMTKPHGSSYRKMCWPNGEDNMSSGSRTTMDVGMYGAGAAPKVGYANVNDGATPLCHVGIFLGACSDCRCSLLISLRTWRGMPLTEWLEWRVTLFFLFSLHVVL